MPYKDPEKRRACVNASKERWRRRQGIKELVTLPPGEAERRLKERRAKHQKRWRKEHPEEWREAFNRWRRGRRLKVIKMYGGKCKCCGEPEPAFLAIDHINGGGGKHIRSFTSPMQYTSWLLAEKRKGFRVLCHNCNMAIAHWGKCPHNNGI